MANSEAPLRRTILSKGLGFSGLPPILSSPTLQAEDSAGSYLKASLLIHYPSPKMIMRPFGLTDLLLGCSKHRNAKVSKNGSLCQWGTLSYSPISHIIIKLKHDFPL